MRKVELVPGLESSILGFGCAPILGAVGGKVAGRALHAALDGGVTHFDLARSYGYGEAEAFLGKFFKGRRDKVVIASKFGIRATWRAGLLRPLKPLARAMRGRGGGNRGTAAAAAAPPPAPETVAAPPRRDLFHERIPFTPEAMHRSLEQSLRALRSDYLDILSIHEPTGEIEHIEALTDAADELKRQGKIRAWGLAFDWSASEFVARSFDYFDLLQFNNSPHASHYAEALGTRRGDPNVFFSPFRSSHGQAPAEVLRQLWTDFPSSVVLCSMFNPVHIAANVAIANESPAVTGAVEASEGNRHDLLL